MTIFPFVFIIATLLGCERSTPTHKVVKTEQGTYKIEKIVKQ